MLTGITDHIHDADFIRNGRITYFENKWCIGNLVAGSRIVEWNCVNNKPAWQFTPVDFRKGLKPVFRNSDTFVSAGCGSQQKLSNRNYLVTESDGGTIYEISRDKEVVWKYVHDKFDGESICGVYWARRYTRDELLFLRGEGRRP